MLRLELTTAAALAACFSLAAAASAAADTRFASPTGTGADCTEPSPCSLKTAINPGVFPGLGNTTDIADGDTVIVGTGDYSVTSFQLRFFVDKDITVRGEPGQPPPTITSDVSSAVDPLFTVSAPGALLEGLRITVTGGQQPEALEVLSGAAPSVVRDVYIEGVDHHSSGPLVTLAGASTLERAELVRFDTTAPAEFDGQTLNTQGDVLVRDSFIRNTGTEVAVRTIAPSTAAKFRNVTVASGSTAIFGATGPQQVSIRNALIDGATTDLHAVNAGVDLSITHSNYNPGQVIEQSGGAVTETPPNQDQTTTPNLFLVDPLNGDFHQTANSPTRNAGSPDAFTGAFDIDGQPRVMGSAIDIGGDEFFESAAAAPGSPSNEFTFGKLKRNKKKGTATLFVTFPGPGQYGLTGKGLKRIGLDSATARASRATAGGVEKLKVRPGKGKKANRLRKRLLDRGKAKVKVRVSFQPSGGTANTRVKKLKLIRK